MLDLGWGFDVGYEACYWAGGFIWALRIKLRGGVRASLQKPVKYGITY